MKKQTLKNIIKAFLNEENLVSAAGVLILTGLIIFIGSSSSTRLARGQWTDPATTPPSANRPTPVLESGNQTRVGNLTINNNLTISGGSAQLQVGGTVQVSGNATTAGILTLNNKANACMLIAFNSNCSASHFWIGVQNSSYVLVNPSPSPTSGFKICCKRY